MIDIKKAKKAFDEYVKDYNMSDEMIYLKYHHTYRVCEQSIKISKSLGLNEEDSNLSYLIALLHDIGRFEQEKRYGTFNDIKSMDHGAFGCKLLFEEGLIRKFIDDDKYDEIIRKAIYNHNKYSIDESLNERELMHAKIIRDIDKIDIIYNVVELGGIVLHDDDSAISDAVKISFNNNKPIKKEDRVTKNDSVMIMFAFIFDLNYKYSYEYFLKNDFVNRMFNKLKNKEIFKEYVDKLNEYIERKCNDVRK